MNTISMVSHRPFQSLHPLSLLAQSISRHISGCLEVTSGPTTWTIYFEQGKLTYASNSIEPFERLDRQLRQLSRQVPTLVSAVRVQTRLLFDTSAENCLRTNADYKAICWLIGQQYLTLSEATFLIEEIAKEVLESFLKVQEGSYEVIPKHSFDDYPNLCQLELRPLVEQCQIQQRKRQQARQLPVIPATEKPVQRAIQGVPASPQYSTHSPTSKAVQSSADFEDKSFTDSATKTRYKIACIDDSPTILHTINAFLDDSSFAVSMINDPIKALMQVVRTQPDLILLDVGMPNLDGYELCSLLRKHPKFKGIPIIMVTGNTGFIDRAKAKLVGASGYLTKPFTQSELLKMVFKHLT